MKLYETGEADPDYTDENMDKIVELLKDAWYDAYYKEFDKYQSVYLVIKKGNSITSSIKLWWDGTFYRGKWNDSNFTPEKEIMEFTFDSGTSSIEYEVGSNDISEFLNLLMF